MTEEKIMKRNIKDPYNKLKSSKVCIVGLGGIGSNLAVSLARSGIGNLYLIDFDIVEESNLNRQYYNIYHIGIKKTDAIKDVIESINPFVNVVCEDIKVEPSNINNTIDKIIKDFNPDYFCEALDDAATKAMLISEILENYSDKVIISSSGMAGINDANEIKTVKRMKNLYVCGDGYTDLDKYDGMMSPRVTICAGHQANILIVLF